MEKSQLTTKIARVAIALPVRGLFDYLAPIEASIGCRVMVQFGNKLVIGIIVELAENSKFKLKTISKILDRRSIFSPKLLELFLWASNYYQYPLGAVLDCALPTWLKSDKECKLPTKKVWRITSNCTTAAISKLAKNTVQHKLASLLVQNKEGLYNEQLTAAGISSYAKLALQKKQLIESVEIDSMPEIGNVQTSSLKLNVEQEKVLDQIKPNLDKFSCHLIDGVTGCGKTEIYLQLIDIVVKRGQQALILVPEINLTPQTIGRFKHRFTSPIASLHSQLTPKQKFTNWIYAKQGIAKIIIGTRSAAFVPLLNPGIFIVDEEHDVSFKQQDSFRYSARDLLIKRAQLEDCCIVLGSATPSLESWKNAKQTKYHYHQLNRRANSSLIPKIQIYDTRNKKLDNGISSKMLMGIEESLQAKQQSLLFINRRGFAPTLFCTNCGWKKECKRCDAHMVVHLSSNEIKCHHCEYRQPIPTSCPSCGATPLNPVGIGTERVEQTLKNNFPSARIARVDRDTVCNQQAISELGQQMHNKEIDILVGTQMLAKGHHFPNINFVGIIDIDGALFSSDFRSLERMGQQIIQVAGRAGRGNQPARVLLQTSNPENQLLQELIEKGYRNFADKLLTERQQAGLPPYYHQVLVRAESKQHKLSLDFLKFVKQQAVNLRNHNVELLGPVTAPMAKKQGNTRSQLLLQSNSKAKLQALFDQLVPNIESNKISRKVRWSIDVDPVEMY